MQKDMRNPKIRLVKRSVTPSSRMLEQIGRKVGYPTNCLGVRESGTEHKRKIQHIIEITYDYSIISQSLISKFYKNGRSAFHSHIFADIIFDTCTLSFFILLCSFT